MRLSYFNFRTAVISFQREWKTEKDGGEGREGGEVMHACLAQKLNQYAKTTGAGGADKK